MGADVLVMNLTVDRNSAIPLYFQLKEQIKELIISGVYMPNDQLPTEEELCEQLSISRPVVRQAYGELIRENLITRRIGSGTYVMDVSQQYYLKEYLMFSYEKSLRLGNCSLVKKMEEICDEKIVRSFPFMKEIENRIQDKNRNSIYQIEKVFSLYGQPQFIVNSYVIGKFAPKFDRCFDDVSDTSVIDLFEKNYGIKLVNATRKLSAKIPDEETKKALKLKDGVLVYTIETKYFDELSRLIIVEYTTMATTHSSFSVDIKR